MSIWGVYSDLDTAVTEYIDGIVRCIKFWRDNSNKNLATQKIREFLSNPSYDNGIVYEIIAYLWFIESGVDIEYQPLIEKENSFKSKGAYNADGKLDGEILFDIKTFSFGQPRYAELQNALNDSLLKETKEQTKTTIGSEIGTTVGANNKDYYIMVTGNVNLSSKEMAEILEKNMIYWFNCLIIIDLTKILFTNFRSMDWKFELIIKKRERLILLSRYLKQIQMSGQ